MSTMKSRRHGFDAVTSPTVIHIHGSQPVALSEAEQIVTKFLDDKEAAKEEMLRESVGKSEDLRGAVGDATVLSQLKRVQRSLRGLPPTLETGIFMKKKEAKGKKSEGTTGEEKKGKHMRFDDDGEANESGEAKKNNEEEIQSVEEDKGEELDAEEQKAEEDVVEDVVEEKVEEAEEKKVKKVKKDKKDKKQKKDKKDKKDKKEKKEKKDKHNKRKHEETSEGSSKKIKTN